MDVEQFIMAAADVQQDVEAEQESKKRAALQEEEELSETEMQQQVE